MAPSHISIPTKLPLFVVSEGVLLPGSTLRIPVTTAGNINLVRSRLTSDSRLSSTVIGIATREPPYKDEIGNTINTYHKIGTAAVVVQVTGTNWPRPVYTVLVTSLCRIRLLSIIQEHPYPVATIKQLEDLKNIEGDDDAQVAELVAELKQAAQKVIDLLGISMPAVAKLKDAIDKVPSSQLTDTIAALVKTSLPEKLAILDAVDLATRIRVTLPLLLRHIQVIEEKDNGKTQNQKKQLVRLSRGGRNLSPAQDIGEEGENDIADLEAKIAAAKMPEEASKAAKKELNRLKRMAPHMPEYSMTRNYLELLVDLPWSACVMETCSITKARQDLDTDHYGLEKVKRRVLEYLAVRQLRGDMKGPILCFVGPPGVGKTSVAKSIATTLGRPYHRMSLGGVSDQHDIRGHRRTYIGAMPGRVIQGLRSVKVKNPVMLLDEIDKLGTGIHGDPGAALLEVLDPEQNFTFTDTYLNLPFDLSQVLFVATANSLSTIPTPLLDRMEVIHVPGYTQEEKVMIGYLHLLPKQLEEHGLNNDIITMPKEAIATIIGEYTREAGVRTLERKIGALCRAVAVKVAESAPEKDEKRAQEEATDLKSQGDEAGPEDNKAGQPEKRALPLVNVSKLQEHMELPVMVDQKMIRDILGPPIFESGLAGRVSVPGVAVGLAWTPVGGEVMVVEASRTTGDSGLTLTGQLGSVMQESAKIALSWVRQHSFLLHLEKDFMKDEEIHMHFPAGAINKDGPSAGVTILTVLVSLLSNRCVRPDVAMTGEITLNGVVLPVGGIKEKLLAAHRAGLTTVIIPAANKKDLADIPNSVLNEVEVVLVNTVGEVLLAAFEDGFPDIVPGDTPLHSKL
ncbi:lon protease homolog 2, peroxisomal-like isoform X2 [Eriocheir sinensis]|uniref:lon protease homolog 2, peroxisomal-like isoform X2 n=1 Tax=Eriocheir sinensis TaxID=95602 RepID=UPI0021C7AC47|nr:lon protease homolog 2, peroxisomal-like isoform X2 [Eriocheir sinensis]